MEKDNNKLDTNGNVFELSDLLCELKNTTESFGRDYEYAERMELKSIGFLKGKIHGAQHIVSIFERYISTIT